VGSVVVVGNVVVVGSVVVVVGSVVVVVVVGNVVVVVAGAHVGTVRASAIKVTVPSWARRRPSTTTSDPTVMLVWARIVPSKREVAPSVAELPTCQKTLHAWVPPVSTTWLLAAVVSEEPAWMTKTAFASPPPSRMTFPVIATVEAEL
jgi:hypothetical protein